jgi:short-subunit dehydrogenase
VKLEGAVCVVTGASRGIGREVARLLHQRGAKVGLLARDLPDLESLANELGAGAIAVTADVTDPSSLQAAFGAVVAALGPVDVLVNNAGIGAYEAFVDADPASFQHLMQVNFFGTVEATRLVVPSMIERGGGHIVNIASIAGRVGAPCESAYSASKFAVIGFTESLTAELAPHGIVTSLVNPGPVKTSFTEARGVPFQRRIPRPIKATRVAKATVAAIERSRFEQILPRWLAIGPITRAVAPGLYRRGLVRSTAGAVERPRRPGA